MTQQETKKQVSQYLLAFVAAGLFYLAGILDSGPPRVMACRWALARCLSVSAHFG
jgi:hypothetical protein